MRCHYIYHKGNLLFYKSLRLNVDIYMLITEHERKYGKIPANAIVNMNSGWGYKYPNAKFVFGTKNLSDVRSFKFPGWSPETCEMLLKERQVCLLHYILPS